MNNEMIWAGVLTVISLVLFLCTYVFKTNIWYYRKAAGKAWSLVGIMVLLAGLAIMWVVTIQEYPWGWGAVGVGLAWLHPVFACGFNSSDIDLPKNRR